MASTSRSSRATRPPPAYGRSSRRTLSRCCARPSPATPACALALLDRQRLLCAHREGPYGVRHWNSQVERWLGEETGEPIWSTWYAGRPLLVTANDYGLGIYNGDIGVVVRPPAGSAGRALRAAIDSSSGRLDLATSRLAQVETMHAMTIHKSQGSQADEVVVILPPPESRLLTRELFYTAITRAQERVVVVGSPGDVRAAIERRAVRATGLRQRLSATALTPKPPRHRRRLALDEVPFLLRVELPDVPGSLGRLASAIGEAGGDIEAIEIVEKRHDGTAVDDVLLEMHGARCRTPSCRRATRSTASRSSGSAGTPPAATCSSTSRRSRS